MLFAIFENSKPKPKITIQNKKVLPNFKQIDIILVQEAITMSDEETRIRVGSAVKDFRIRKNYSMTQLANKVGCSRQMIGQIEDGSKSPSFELAVKLSDVMHVPLSTLTGQPETVENINNGIDIYEDTEEYPGLGLPSYKRKYSLKALRDNNKNNVTYKLDEGLGNIRSTDLYAVRLTKDNKILNAPAGAFVIVQYKNTNIDLKKPLYCVVDYAWPPRNYEAGFNTDGKIKIHDEFITKVTKLSGMNEWIGKDTHKYGQYYKFVLPNGNEYYADEKTMRELIRGVVRKIIIDFD